MIDFVKYRSTFAAFKKAHEDKIQAYMDLNVDRNDYLKNGIASNEHPLYFFYLKEWEKTREMLDAPLIERAYYKIGQTVHFSKRMIYRSQDTGLLLDKINSDAYYPYYKTVIATGIISRIHTSDAGTGELVYCFESLTPACPESNPHVLEKDIITV